MPFSSVKSWGAWARPRSVKTGRNSNHVGSRDCLRRNGESHSSNTTHSISPLRHPMSTASQLMAHLSQFSSCEISDALVKLGVASGGHIPDITMFSPSRDAENVKICGPAYTVKMVHASDRQSPSPSVHFVDAAPADHIIFISAPPRTPF